MTQLLFSFIYNLPAIMLALSLFFIFVFIAFRRKRTINDYQQIKVFNSIFKKYLIINLIFSLIILKLNIDDIFDMPAVYILGFIFLTLLTLIFVHFNYFKYNSLTSLRTIKIRSIHFMMIIAHFLKIIILLMIIFKNQYYF